MSHAVLGYIRFIDWMSAKFGQLASWLVFLACMVSAGNAMIRYTFNIGSNAWLELQWYLFSATVFFGARSCSSSTSTSGWM